MTDADNIDDIPRPLTRADCGQEARPCPWVGCRHHLAIEVAASGAERARPTALRLNRIAPGARGRRSGLKPSASHDEVGKWADDAVSHLSVMAHTCSLDVAERYPDGLSEDSVGALLGVTGQALGEEARAALAKLRAAAVNSAAG